MKQARAAIRMDATGMRWERWDNFSEEWHPLPIDWSKRDALEYVAGIWNITPGKVIVEARAA